MLRLASRAQVGISCTGWHLVARVGISCAGWHLVARVGIRLLGLLESMPLSAPTMATGGQLLGTRHAYIRGGRVGSPHALECKLRTSRNAVVEA